MQCYGVGLGSLGGGVVVSLGGVSDGGGMSDGGGVADGSVGVLVSGIVVVESAGGGAVSSGSFLAQPAIKNAAVSNANKARMNVSFSVYTGQIRQGQIGAIRLCCRRITG